jgi:hypothetical protein
MTHRKHKRFTAAFARRGQYLLRRAGRVMLQYGDWRFLSMFVNLDEPDDRWLYWLCLAETTLRLESSVGRGLERTSTDTNGCRRTRPTLSRESWL